MKKGYKAIWAVDVSVRSALGGNLPKGILKALGNQCVCFIDLNNSLLNLDYKVFTDKKHDKDAVSDIMFTRKHIFEVHLPEKNPGN